jgi:hypothetical protein
MLHRILTWLGAYGLSDLSSAQAFESARLYANGLGTKISQDC